MRRKSAPQWRQRYSGGRRLAAGDALALALGVERAAGRVDAAVELPAAPHEAVGAELQRAGRAPPAARPRPAGPAAISRTRSASAQSARPGTSAATCRARSATERARPPSSRPRSYSRRQRRAASASGVDSGTPASRQVARRRPSGSVRSTSPSGGGRVGIGGVGRDHDGLGLLADDPDGRRRHAGQLAEEPLDGRHGVGLVRPRIARGVAVAADRRRGADGQERGGLRVGPAQVGAQPADQQGHVRAQRAPVGVDLVEHHEPAAVAGEQALPVRRADQEVLEHLVVGQQQVGRPLAEPVALGLGGAPVVHRHPDRVAVAASRAGSAGCAPAGRWPGRSSGRGPAQTRPGRPPWRTASSMAACKAGTRKHSVLPEPVPVVTTTGEG